LHRFLKQKLPKSQHFVLEEHVGTQTTTGVWSKLDESIGPVACNAGRFEWTLPVMK
jgi:hypothetical protein